MSHAAMPVSRQHQLHPATQQHRWHSPSLPFKRVVRRCSRLAASAWGAPEPFLPAPSLSSIAEMQQQLDRELDSAFMAPFSSMRRFEDRMDQQFREMDRQMDRAFADMDRVQRDLDAELARSMRKLQQQVPGVKIERREERAPGAYRYYESIQIHSGSGMTITALTPAHTASSFNPLLLFAVMTAGAYAAVTAAFNRNYDLTTYKQQGKWQLLLVWPFLLTLSQKFRHQFVSALKGEKVKVLDRMSPQGSNNSSAGGISSS